MIKLHKEVLKGSIILLIVFNAYSLLNFVFQAVMARLLSLADYGVLAALSYLLYLLSIFSESLQTIIAKYSSVEHDRGKLKSLLKKSLFKVSPFSLLLFIVYLGVSLPIFLYREIPYTLLILNGLFIFTSLSLPIARGILQGRQRFYGLGGSLLVEGVFRLGASVLLVLMGWQVYGAIAGTLIGMALSFLFSLFLMRDITKSKEKKAETLGLRENTKTVFIALFALLAFYIVDIFVAQWFFTKEVAGQYAIASMLSKAIFWGTQPISRAMFPVSAARTTTPADRNPHTIYFNALLLLIALIVPGLIIIYFFPSLIIHLFSGRVIPESVAILFYLCLATSLLSFANLNILYKLSRNKIKNPGFFFIIFALGIIFLLLFNQTIVEFSLAFLAASSIFFIASLFYLKN